MLREHIREVLDMYVYRGRPYACTCQMWTCRFTDRDIQAGLEKKFGWVVPIGTIKAFR